MKLFWLPQEVWYYVVIPIIAILFLYFLFYLIYKRKKGSYYYNYVVDYVYSTLGIIFCGLLFCLLLGYSIATFQILITNNMLNNYIILAIVLVILPIIPSCFLVYVIMVYLRNLKRKEVLDANLKDEENLSKEDTVNTSKDSQVELKKKS